ncbi:Vacuolar protein sorting-associated protein SNF8 [Actinomortierella ambigua]|uniref:Vacuolar protein sorting-associated protein SNF8 n=1 Tax=Actinomortierella ambigua TaxID=1343610 RepID=A0A9P6PSE3_9FUNG|nr:Vacuolar protein sorting-associated protein SNF8 [Actinomortierella ambigua]
MCANIGVDPLASSKGYWGELLGVGDFYYELGIQIIDVCLSTRALNGGLIELSDLKHRVERMRGVRNDAATTVATTAKSKTKDTNMEITEDDLLRSIKTLAPLGNGFQVIEIGGKKMVSSVPRELNRDQSLILALIQVGDTNGHVNVQDVCQRLGWEQGRSVRALNTLLDDGLMWVDQQIEPFEYWVPGFFVQEEDEDYAAVK